MIVLIVLTGKVYAKYAKPMRNVCEMYAKEFGA